MSSLVISLLALTLLAAQAAPSVAAGRFTVTLPPPPAAAPPTLDGPPADQVSEDQARQDASREDPVYAYDAVVVGASRFDFQHNGSYGKMIAVSSDGIVHGAFTGGADNQAGRRVKAWCWDEWGLFPPMDVLWERTGFTTTGVTSAAPPNWAAPNSTVTSLHTGTLTWFGVDFAGCTHAFNLVMAPDCEDRFWPHLAVDYQDRGHLVTRGAQSPYANTVWYAASTSLDAFDAPCVLVSSSCRTVSPILTAAKEAPGVALVYLPHAAAAPAPLDEATVVRGNDVCLFETRAAGNDLAAVIADTANALNLTRFFDPASSAPFRGAMAAYADVDAIYDGLAEPGLHVAFTAPLTAVDSVLYEDLADHSRFAQPFAAWQDRSALWHVDAGSGEWGHIGGWLTGDGEADELPVAFAGTFRSSDDRVQLAHDPATGRLYALWNQYRLDDRRAGGADGKRMANGDLVMACSADGGASWGPRVNLTDSHTPDCDSPDCWSETFGSLAETVSDGVLHVTFMMDQHAGASVRSGDETDGSLVTVNNVYYLRVPATAVPPPAGAAWDAAGHLGLDRYRRYWHFTSGHPDTVRAIDRVSIFNEGRQERRLVELRIFHGPQDVLGGPESDLWAQWEVQTGDAVQPGAWIVDPSGTGDWDGRLPAWTATPLHLSVGHRGLPAAEQVFRFTFDDGTRRDYRFTYQDDDGASLVETLDLDDLEQYPSRLLYRYLPIPTLTLHLEAPGVLRLTWEAVPGATWYRLYESADLGAGWQALLTTAATGVTLAQPLGHSRLYRVTAGLQ